MPATRPPLERPAETPVGSGASAMHALYSAALGPVLWTRNRALFERFDLTGRARIGWNPAASLFTLNWMVLHHLWNAALIYVALVEGLALLVFGAGRTWLHWPSSVQWGLMAGFALFAFAMPGMFGDALLHGETRKRIAHALGAARTVPEACTLLMRQASSWKRLQWIALGNGVLLAALAALWWIAPSIVESGTSAPETAIDAGRMERAAASSIAVDPPIAALPQSRARSTTAMPAEPALAKANVFNRPEATDESRGPAPPPTADTNLRTQGAESAEKRSSGPEALAEKPTRDRTVQSGAKPHDPPNRESKNVMTAEQATGSNARQQDRQGVQRPAEPPANTQFSNSSEAKPMPEVNGKAIAATGEAAAGAESWAPIGSAEGFYLNVGVFAEEANARRAQAKLLNAGLPAFRNDMDSGSGPRTRVRVGPFASAAQALKAGHTVRGLGLEAVMYQQRGP